jgi:LacI family transcriptional regulator
MNMKEIARALGVSQTTVSLTLSGKADKYGIAAETQARVREYVRSVGYVPDSHAAAMASGKTRTVGIIIPGDAGELTESQRAIFFGLLHALHREGIVPLIQAIDEETCYAGVRLLAGQKAEELVVIGFTAITLCESCPDILPLLRDCRVYLVDYLFSDDAECPLPGTVRIGIDRERSFGAAAALLRASGHRTIATLQSVLYFLEGRTGELQFHLLPDDDSVEDIYQRGRRMLPAAWEAMRAGCTAVLLRDDMMALGLIAALREDGVRVPDDLSIIGFDNIPASAYAAVPLTTIEVPAKEMLETLCARLLRGEGGEADCLLPGRLVERASVGASPVLI